MVYLIKLLELRMLELVLNLRRIKWLLPSNSKLLILILILVLKLKWSSLNLILSSSLNLLRCFVGILLIWLRLEWRQKSWIGRLLINRRTSSLILSRGLGSLLLCCLGRYRCRFLQKISLLILLLNLRRLERMRSR